EHYTREIQSNPKWKFIDIYADEGISGTNTKKRTEFNRMIEDCMAGKIDMVLTKSVSRFARNTVDCITYIRQLKEKNIAVFFEKENINTLDGAGELLITILGSLAQEESRSLSTNTRWGVVRRFEKGQVYLNHTQFLGYSKNQDGELVIVQEEAETVRLIFRLYLEGYSFEKIKKHLEENDIKTATGKDKWYVSTIGHMLSNEKYMGDALLQKSYTTDFINKTRVKNTGIVPQYYVEGSHEGIISKELWNRVQEERARRANIRKPTDKRAKTDTGKYSSKYALSDLVLCGECGKPYRRATWTNYTEKRIVWRCYNRQEYGKKYCKNSPTIDELLLQAAIMNAINQLIGDKDDFMGTLASNLQMVMGKHTKVIDIPAMDKRLEELKTEMLALVTQNVKSGINNVDFDEAYEKIAAERKQLLKEKNEYTEQQVIYDTYHHRVSEMKKYLGDMNCAMTEFDNDLVRRLIQSVKVLSKEKIVITFKSGIEMEQAVEVREKHQDGRAS
ncbi:MAG: serine recombinase, partial [Clostridiales bacterium GWB2_37_7]